MGRLCLCQHRLSKHTRVGRHARKKHTRAPFHLLATAPELTVQVDPGVWE